MKNINLFKNKHLKTYLKYFSSNTSTTSLLSYELISKNKDIGLLTIKNSSKRNALSYEILSGLVNQLQQIESDFSKNKFPRVLIISSEGSVFSSGHDLKELNNSHVLKIIVFDSASDVMMLLQKLSPIVIAEIQGLATAAGCQLAASCDLIVASSKAKFETPGVRIGLFCSSPSVALSRAISQKRAMHMLVTGEQINAIKAQDWGLVNEVVDVENITSEEEQGKNYEKKV